MAKKKDAAIDTEDLLVFGYSCKLFRDDEKAKIIDEGQHLIPWMGNDSLKIDRYDARGTLYDLSRVEAPPGGYDRFIELTETERAIELACDEERYRSFHINEEEQKLHAEEEEKRKNSNYGQIGYNYEEKKDEVKVEPEPEDNRPFVPSPMLDIPLNMALPATIKHNAIIEKTAYFISSQGAQMEIILKAKQTGNPMFDFLTFGNPLHGYYRLILGYIKSGRYVAHTEPEPEPVPDEPSSVADYSHPKMVESAPALSSTQDEDSNTASVYSELLMKLKKKAQVLKSEQEEREAEERLRRAEEARVKEEAARLEMLRKAAERLAQESKVCPPPDVQLNIAKMASYASKNGRKFESAIRNKKDPRFAFLEPAHEFHEIYLKKIRSYQGLDVDEKSSTPPSGEAEPAQPATAKEHPKIAPISFAIKPKEAPSIRERSALPVEEENSDIEDGETPTEFELIEGETKTIDKNLQVERKRKVSAFLKSLNVQEGADSKCAKKIRSASLDDSSMKQS